MSNSPPNQTSQPIDVACAVIEDSNGRILVAQRGEGSSHAGKWEFPGGKLEEGEDAVAALEREIEEELGCEIGVVAALRPTEHIYPGITIRLIPFRCAIVSGTPEAREHVQISWLLRDQLPGLDWAEADLPVVEEVCG